MAQDIPPELMALMKGGQGEQNAPRTSPMMTPQPNEGEKMEATAKVSMCQQVLEQTLAEFGSQTEEGMAVIDALKVLGKKFGGSTREKGKELESSQIANLVASLTKQKQQQMQQIAQQQGMPQQQPQGGQPQMQRPM